MIKDVYYYTENLKQDKDIVSYDIVIPGYNILKHIESSQDKLSALLCETWVGIKATIAHTDSMDELPKKINESVRDHLQKLLDGELK